MHRAPTLFALLTLALTGCPDAPTPTTTPSPLPQPRTSGSLTPGLPSTSAPTTTPAPTTAASPPPGLRTIVYRKHGEPVVGELRSEPDDDPVVLSTEHGEVSLPRSLIRYVRQPGDPPPPPDVLALQAQANAGDPAAMVALGTALELGRSVAVDPPGAFRWYRRAALAGDPAGMSRLAWAYQQGIGTPIDLDGFKRWVRRAAAAGDPFARGLAQHEGLLKGGPIAARAAFQEAAEADDARGCVWLATMLTTGRGGPADRIQAQTWLRYGARLGNPACMTALGRAIERGRGRGSIEVAAEWYRRAAKQSDPAGLTALGRLHRDGKGVPRDPRKAVALWLQAAQTGRRDGAVATYLLARALETGAGVARDLDQAKLWYARAAQHGHSGAIARLRVLQR